MPKYPLTDILIVTHNARQKLARCLGSVVRHTRGVPYQLTVVDNASADGTSEYLEKNFSKKVRLIKSGRNLGFSGGANLLLRKTSRPWVVLLDDDAEVTPGWLETFYALAAKNPGTGIVGGKVVYPDKRIFCAEFGIIPFGSAGRGESDRGQRDYTKEVDALPGPCWLMPRQVIEKVGPFDERFFPCQYEDIDYCLRVRLAGYKIFYAGEVKIIHHNLYRKGSSVILNRNVIKFFKKWRRTLKRFPLCRLNATDLLVVQGARLLCKEAFLPVHPIFGKWASLNSRFSESFYRGIALTAFKQYKKAAGAFHETVAATQHEFSRMDPEKAAFRYVLSVYLARIGLKRESQRQAEPIMNWFSALLSMKNDILALRNLAPSFVKEIVLHKWSIRALSKDSRYLDILARSLPYYGFKGSPVSSPRPALPSLEISFLNKIHEKNSVDFSLGKDYSRCGSAKFSVFCGMKKNKNRILIVANQEKFFKDNWIFHGAFLVPLSLLLRFQRASLVHGALLQKDGRGILILGEKGAGKSTLSTVCMKRGFLYFSDEHPILEFEAGRVQGRSFVNKIALTAVSAKKNFSDLLSRMEWSNSRKKYLLDPSKVWARRIGAVTRISRVIFPKFKLDAEFSVKRMNRDVFFQRLLEDEYLRITLEKEQKNPEKSAPRRIAALLAKTARGYAIEYGPGDIPRLPALLERL